ncbi:Integral membrane sensor signal transduction histidine kinase [Bifidobacterium hapali]|uniref:histidine kinase n=1 Tax=Bifidobacterium hapali TaxID=1630172 RepID=A0A261FYH3_9BIFI|nr:HAMP domain-containing sensor histidine kinase [Bifidobacterium hapali]OZG64222.1 Integral membrane sensor signal transduction histidine kinase [Bifidobacterium hapali]
MTTNTKPEQHHPHAHHVLGRIWDCATRVCSHAIMRLTPKSFRAQLTVAISIVFLIAIGSATTVQTAIVNGMFSYAMTITTNRQVTGGITMESNGVVKGDTPVDLGAGSTTTFGSSPQSEHANGTSNNTSSNANGSATGNTTTPTDDNYHVDWGKDGSFTITTPYGISIWNQDTVTNGLRISAAVIFILFGAVSVLVIWLVTSRMSRQLKSISDQAAALDPSKLDTRIDVNGSKHTRAGQSIEVTQLGNAINGMLERIQHASEAERRFVSNASHELRTPIAAVETNLDAPLAQGRFPADVEPSVRRALAANRRGAQLVQALLTLSRIQSGTINAQQAQSDTVTTSPSACLNDCVTHAIDDVQDNAVERHITIHADNLPITTLTADATLLDLAVGNLIRNAVVHNTDGGSVDVTIANEHHHVTLTVTNTTNETLPDDLTELMQPFHRGEHSRISAVPGVGLGLSIAAAACDAMGTQLTLSRPSASTFRAAISVDTLQE